MLGPRIVPELSRIQKLAYSPAFSFMEACNIVWFRRDLRLDDNPAFSAAAAAPGLLIPVFLWCPNEEGEFQPGRASRWWLKQSLKQLSFSLQRFGSTLFVQKGTDSLAALLEIAKSTGATNVFCNHLYDPISVSRDRRVKQGLLDHGILVHTYNSDTIYEPWEVYDNRGHNFTIFEAFWSRCLSMALQLPAPALSPKPFRPYSGRLPHSCHVEELGLESEAEKGSNEMLARSWSPGWNSANKQLETFLSGPLKQYAVNTKTVSSSRSTSYLSPYLHFGELSVRKVFFCLHSRHELSENTLLFLRSIGLREYSRYVSYHFPFTQEKSSLLKNFPWKYDPSLFVVWKQGRTGYPLIDAAMRELWATGWLHCKLRVVVSSFLVKFLLLPWTWGMKHFWETLLDADLESDVLGWKFVAGCLVDGHATQRMVVPHVEGCILDPDGEYVRRWLPELARLPKEWIHHPWNAPYHALQAAGVELGYNYPRPIIEVETAQYRLQQAVQDMHRKDAAEQAERSKEGQDESTQTSTKQGSCDQLVPTAACEKRTSYQ